MCAVLMLILYSMQLNREPQAQMNFIGRRLNTKEDIKLTIFQAEIPVSIYAHLKHVTGSLLDNTCMYIDYLLPGMDE